MCWFVCWIFFGTQILGTSKLAGITNFVGSSKIPDQKPIHSPISTVAKIQFQENKVTYVMPLWSWVQPELLLELLIG